MLNLAALPWIPVAISACPSLQLPVILLPVGCISDSSWQACSWAAGAALPADVESGSAWEFTHPPHPAPGWSLAKDCGAQECERLALMPWVQQGQTEAPLCRAGGPKSTHVHAIGFLPLPVLRAPPTSQCLQGALLSAVVCSGIFSSRSAWGELCLR